MSLSITSCQSSELGQFLSISFSAMSWAIAAGREDLMEKKMSSVVKYFLCSEHFTSGCFADPPFNTRLKKMTRPEVSIPIPTIFENNIDKYIPKNAQSNLDQSQMGDDISFNGNELNECYNCEVPTDVHFMDAEMPDINHSGIAINGLINDPAFVDCDALDSLSDSYDFVIENQITQTAHVLPPEQFIESKAGTFMCRLCADTFASDTQLSQISSINGLIDRLHDLLPNMVSFLFESQNKLSQINSGFFYADRMR